MQNTPWEESDQKLSETSTPKPEDSIPHRNLMHQTENSLPNNPQHEMQREPAGSPNSRGRARSGSKPRRRDHNLRELRTRSSGSPAAIHREKSPIGSETGGERASPVEVQTESERETHTHTSWTNERES